MDHPTVQGHNAHQGSVRWEAQIDVDKNWRCEFANKLSYMAFCQAPCNLRRWKKHILWLYLQIDLNFIHMSGLCVAFFSLKGIFLGAFLNPSAAPRWWPLQQSWFPASKSNPGNMGLVEPMWMNQTYHHWIGILTTVQLLGKVYPSCSYRDWDTVAMLWMN